MQATGSLARLHTESCCSLLLGEKSVIQKCTLCTFGRRQKKTQVQTYCKKKTGTDSVRCPAFPKRYWVPPVSANVSRSSALSPRLRSAGTANGRSFHFHQPSAVPTGDFSICPQSKGWFWFPACAAQGTPSRACQSHHPLLSYAWGRRAGGAVIWQLLFTRDLSRHSHFFPWVFIYIFLSSNCTGH